MDNNIKTDAIEYIENIIKDGVENGFEIVNKNETYSPSSILDINDLSQFNVHTVSTHIACVTFRYKNKRFELSSRNSLTINEDDYNEYSMPSQEYFGKIISIKLDSSQYIKIIKTFERDFLKETVYKIEHFFGLIKIGHKAREYTTRTIFKIVFPNGYVIHINEFDFESIVAIFEKSFELYKQKKEELLFQEALSLISKKLDHGK